MTKDEKIEMAKQILLGMGYTPDQVLEIIHRAWPDGEADENNNKSKRPEQGYAAIAES